MAADRHGKARALPVDEAPVAVRLAVGVDDAGQAGQVARVVDGTDPVEEVLADAHFQMEIGELAGDQRRIFPPRDAHGDVGTFFNEMADSLDGVTELDAPAFALVFALPAAAEKISLN